MAIKWPNNYQIHNAFKSITANKCTIEVKSKGKLKNAATSYKNTFSRKSNVSLDFSQTYE